MLLDKSKWIIPSAKDPRWLLCLFLGIYSVFGHFFLSFNRSMNQMVTAVVACVVLDMLYTWVLCRKILFPLSALISAFGLIILFTAPGEIWFMLMVSWLTITGKYVITWRGHHFFNPTNFALVFMLIVAGEHTAIAPSYQWGSTWWMPIIVFALGLLLMWRVNKLPVVLSFWACFALGAFVRSHASQMPLQLTLWAQISGGAFMLFSFYMITDPKTSPASTKGMILFGAALGFVDTLFQIQTAVFSIFYALFTVTIIRGVYYIIQDMRVSVANRDVPVTLTPKTS